MNCQDDNTLLNDDYIKENIYTLEKRLNLTNKVSMEPFENITYKTLQISYFTFTYLCFCPPELFNFLNHLTKTKSPKTILLALTSILKTSQNAAKESSRKIFTQAMEIFRLNHYKQINIVTQENGFKALSMKKQKFASNVTIQGLGQYEVIDCLLFLFYS